MKPWFVLTFLAPLLLRAQAPGDWTSYGKNPLGWRYSELSAINTTNVSRLSVQWIRQLTLGVGGYEATPLVQDGIIYLTGPSNTAWALDGITGHPLWSYKKTPPGPLNLCCGQVNRGFAMLGDKLFKVNVEGTLVALDTKSGAVLWETQIADYKQGFSATNAPLVVKNLVLTGIAGAEFGTRGFVDAYDAETGKRVWRFYTVAGAGEPGSESWGGESWKRGGGSTWVTGTYDPELNIVYWGTGNPGPDMNGDVRKGDNLYTCSIVALDADTGKLLWHFQMTPHDVHDWDAISDPVLTDLTVAGKPVKAVVQANRNGFFYALDRVSGKFLFARAYTKVTWADGIGSDGRPILVKGMEPTEEGTKACPGIGGGHNWQPSAYHPRTGLLYFPSEEGCHLYYKTSQDFVEGRWYQASTVDDVPKERMTGSIVAVNAATGQTKWRFEMISGTSAGVLATAGGLLFGCDGQGYLIAFDAANGKVLWKFQTGGHISAPPISYALNGRQYIALLSGQSLVTFALPK
jgi:alcohol dehydrogenase (cytochrome c)